MNIKKVLLITPPAFSFKNNIDINPVPPMGLAYIAGLLEKERDVEIRIIDSLGEGWEQVTPIQGDLVRIGLSFEEIEKIIREYAPDVIGVSNLFTKQSANAHRIHAIAKGINPDIVTVAGGAHPTVLPDKVMEDPNVDFVVIGEGEYTFLKLLEVLEGKRNITELDGIAYRDSEGVKIVPQVNYIKDLDEMPFPARHLLKMDLYYGLKASHGTRRRTRFAPVITSRGCPAKCTFCSANKVWGHGYRMRSPENVVAELRILKEQFGIEELMFEDDNLTLNSPRAEKLFDLMIQEGFGFVWDTPNGVAAYSLSENLIKKMKDSGCYKINLAVETGNQDVMDNIIKKPLKLDKIKPIIDYARKIDLEVGMFLVIGMPGEKPEQIMDSFRFARSVGVYAPFISVATPYPGTELFDICVDKHYISEDLSWDNLFIRSFSITTEDWDGHKLQEILKEGRLYLIKALFKDHPLVFLKEYLPRICKDPRYFIRKLLKMSF